MTELMLCALALAQPAPETVLRPVDYDGLTAAVRGLRGRVVLVDFWFDACLPCKREFPKLVALQNKYRSRGLAAVTVNLDVPGDAAALARAERFLLLQKADCLNLHLLEPAEVWRGRLGVEALPCVFLFDREGRLLHRWDDREVDYDEIGRRVGRALAP